MVFSIFEPTDVRCLLDFFLKSQFSAKAVKLVVLKLTLLVKVILCSSASDSSNTMELVLVVELTNDCGFVWALNIILCSDLWLEQSMTFTKRVNLRTTSLTALAEN
jgi:hypothetical protein